MTHGTDTGNGGQFPTCKTGSLRHWDKASDFRDASNARNKQSIEKLECSYFQIDRDWLCVCVSVLYVYLAVCVVEARGQPQCQQTGSGNSQSLCVLDMQTSVHVHIYVKHVRYLSWSLSTLLTEAGSNVKLANLPFPLASFSRRSNAPTSWVLGSQVRC